MSWQYRTPKIFPGLYSEKSFFYNTKIKPSNYRLVVNSKKLYYKTRLEPKKDGVRYRKIYLPSSLLASLLSKISKNILSKISYQPFIHCGPKGKSILTACKRHSKFDYHLALDINSFFDNVSQQTVLSSLLKIKIKRNIAN